MRALSLLNVSGNGGTGNGRNRPATRLRLAPLLGSFNRTPVTSDKFSKGPSSFILSRGKKL